MPPAISGSGGHAAAFSVAKALCHDFDLSMGDARVLFSEYNLRCTPPWSEREIVHKLESASRLTSAKRGKGALAEASPAPAFRPSARLGTLGTLKINSRRPSQSGTLGTLVSETYIYGRNKLTEKSPIQLGFENNRPNRPKSLVLAPVHRQLANKATEPSAAPAAPITLPAVETAPDEPHTALAAASGLDFSGFTKPPATYDGTPWDPAETTVVMFGEDRSVVEVHRTHAKACIINARPI